MFGRHPRPSWWPTILFAVWVMVTPPVAAQGPSADWQTLETPHYRVHYPAPAEAWARAAAERLEAVRQRVADEVGYTPTEITDVIVSDPIARPNGTAWPIRGWPRMLLWTTPPGPDSVIGHYRDWPETLLIHEDVHLVHLLRPSRRPAERWLGGFMPAGPVLRKTPLWAIEGYATLLEGQLTGRGRPNSDLRATILRRWAQRGDLPTYWQMESGGESWYGLSMAYLMGSAYLEWLVERTGPDALTDLWARLSARHPRSFDDAFAGVFSDTPQVLYNRFRAELTFRAMTLEQSMAPELREGALWQDLRWTTGAPAVSPSGDRLALVVRSRRGPSRLVVWSTEPPEEEEEAWLETRERLAALDPEDVPVVRSRPLPRDPLHTLPTRDGAEPHDPRWSADGSALLYTRFEPDGEGYLRPDLFRWSLATGRVERLTHGAATREIDPAPAGGWGVAVRQEWGAGQLVAVDFASGAVNALTSASIDTVYHHPRIAPTGDRLAVVVHREGAWSLEIHGLEGRRLLGAPQTLPIPRLATVAHPAWSPDGSTLYAAVGDGGVLDIRAWSLGEDDTSETRRIARHHGAALAPAPTREALFYLSLESDGLDLRRLDLGTAQPTEVDAPKVADTPSYPALRPPEPPPVPALATQTLPEPRPYGLGRFELLPLLGGAWGPGAERLELGARGGDLLGRFEILALNSTGDPAHRGSTLTATWRGWPIDVTLRALTLDDRPSRQDDDSAPLGSALDAEHRGIEVSARWDHRTRRRGFVAQAGHYAGRFEPLADAASSSETRLDHQISWLATRLGVRRDLGAWSLTGRLSSRVDLGSTEGESWRRWGGGVAVIAAQRDGARLTASWRRFDSDDLTHPVDRFRVGGLDSSLLPEALRGARTFVPALPAATLVGDRVERRRIGLELRRWPIELFAERHRVGTASDWDDWIDLVGAEIRWRRGRWPLLRLPAFELRLGVAGPAADEIEGWLGLTWYP